MNTAKLIELLDAGASHSEIARQLCCTRSAVSYAAKKLGRQPQNMQRGIDIKLLRKEVTSGVSFSEFCRRHDHTLAAVSRVAKKHNIQPPGRQHIRKQLPDAEIYEKYQDGTSLDALHNEYKVSIATIKRHLLSVDSTISFRDVSTKRPAILNCKEELEVASRCKSYRLIARELGVKLATVTKAARKFGLPFDHVIRWDHIDDELLIDLYLVQGLTPSQIATHLEYPYGVVLRQLKKARLPIAEPGGASKPSKFPELNDTEWLAEQYKTKSANEIAIDIGATSGMVLYHLRRHGITIRSRDQVLKLLLSRMHGLRSEHHGVECHSQLEVQYLDMIPKGAEIERDVLLSARDSHCLIDFQVDGKLVEVKPKEVLTQTGPDRRRLVKQYMICALNQRPLEVWTPAGYWDQQICDEDIYYAVSWKLFFDSPTQCADWLIAYGFHEPKHGLLSLADAAAKMLRCPEHHTLNANFNNHMFSKLVEHFFPHYWHSSHDGYMPPSKAWSIGNHMVLKEAVTDLWEQKKEVSIYGLMKHIAKFYKDFARVSLFKPWIAAFIYDRYLQKGGTVVDPCCGWGGRLMGCVGRQINYIGMDLNGLAVDSHRKLSGFLGSRVVTSQFSCADASVCDFPEADLLFTSPPYDSTELYHGINSRETLTIPILENIFSKVRYRVVLNIPHRLERACIDLATAHGMQLIEQLQMKTGSFMGRKQTYEPILVFDKA